MVRAKAVGIPDIGATETAGTTATSKIGTIGTIDLSLSILFSIERNLLCNMKFHFLPL